MKRTLLCGYKACFFGSKKFLIGSGPVRCGPRLACRCSLDRRQERLLYVLAESLTRAKVEKSETIPDLQSCFHPYSGISVHVFSE